METELKDILKKYLETKSNINNISLILSDNRIIAFNETSLLLPDLSIYVHGFYTSISWFYIQYFEIAKTTIDFLSDIAFANNLAKESIVNNYLKLIHSFRTLLQHNLNLNRKEDLLKNDYCKNWINTIVNSVEERYISWPKSEDQWQIILYELWKESIIFIEILYKALLIISEDKDGSKDTVNIWYQRIKRKLSPFEFDEIIETVFEDLGLIHLDIIPFRNRHHEKWNKYLYNTSFNTDSLHIARLLIERTILEDNLHLIPITGKDIIDELGILPGPTVKKLLEYTHKIYKETPCDKNELLSKLDGFNE